MNKKLKIVWLCHFSNKELRDILPLSKNVKYSDYAPWISSLLKEFEKSNDIELHVIIPHAGLKKLTYTFSKNGIFYYVYKPDLPFIHKQWPLFFPIHKWTKFIKNRILIKYFINKIKPDLINLHGAECSHFSISVLDIKKIPIYVCIQGIYSNPLRFNNFVKPDKLRIKVEKQIHEKCNYFGIFSPFFEDLIRKDNKNPIFLKQSYVLPTKLPENINYLEKKYDFVFFGWVSEVKGIDKVIEAVSLISKQKKDVSLLIIGNATNEYLSFLKCKINELGLEENITFVGHLATITEVYELVTSAKVSVVSSKFDNLPSTILESIFLGLPVVATSVGGIPYLNKDGETILLSKYGDTEELAYNMKRLLDDPELGQTLAKKCKEFIFNEFGGEITVRRYVSQYLAIIDNFKLGIQIPIELRFNKSLYENSSKQRNSFEGSN